MKQILEKLRKETVYQECFEEANIFEDGVSARLHITDGKKITRVRVDDCLITSKKTKKCDYIAYHPAQEKILLIELKSTLSKKAKVIRDQFLGCLNFLKSNSKQNEYCEKKCICVLIYKKRADTKTQSLSKYLYDKDIEFKYFYDQTIVKKTITNLF